MAPWPHDIANPRVAARNLSPGMATRHARMRAPRREKGGLAEISGFSYRARSLLCKREIGRQTATSEGAGDSSRDGAEFRGTDSSGRAVPASAHGAVAGLRSCAQRGRIRPGSRLSRSLLRMVFIHSSLGEPARPCSTTKPAAGREPMHRASPPRRGRESRHTKTPGSRRGGGRLPLPVR